MEDSENTDSLFSNLLCQEHETCLIDRVEDGDYSEKISIDFLQVIASDDQDEYIGRLIRKESDCFGSHRFAPFSHCSVTNWFQAARLDSIDWILNARVEFGFRLQTAYLSVTYFDRFISKRSIDDGKLWAVRLLSVACLSLAAKMEELNVPALSKFQVQGYDFCSRTIQRMELLILSTLEWKLGSITPFTYLHYFISKFCHECESTPRRLVSGATKLIMAMTKEIELMDIRSSIIAAAAVLAAVDGPLSRQNLELKMSLLSLWHSQDYEILERKDKTPPKCSISPLNVLSIHSSSTDVLENSVGTKRRLTFSDSDDLSCPTKKTHMP